VAEAEAAAEEVAAAKSPQNIEWVSMGSIGASELRPQTATFLEGSQLESKLCGCSFWMELRVLRQGSSWQSPRRWPPLSMIYSDVQSASIGSL
jgi:hypothetical protein